jgi:hypothetical protein
LDSDGLENTREAEEESELSSVQSNPILNEQQCQAPVVQRVRVIAVALGGKEKRL